MAYVETLMSEYAPMSLTHILLELPLVAGMALLEARRCRLDPAHAIGWQDRLVMRANAETRRWFETHYEVIDPEPKGAA
jgi:hypothetical protein